MGTLQKLACCWRIFECGAAIFICDMYKASLRFKHEVTVGGRTALNNGPLFHSGFSGRALDEWRDTPIVNLCSAANWDVGDRRDCVADPHRRPRVDKLKSKHIQYIVASMQPRVRFSAETKDEAEVEVEVDSLGAAAPKAASRSDAADGISSSLAASALASDAVTPEVEARARDFIARAGLDEGDREGLIHMQNLTLSMGLHSARACFRAMLDANAVVGAARAAAEKEITAFSPVTEIGCMRVDFFNMITAAPDTAYLVLDKCPAAHDLSAQLNKLHRLVDSDKWIEVLKHLSMLVNLGRSVYNQIAQQHKPLLRRIYRRDAANSCDDLLHLGVDSRNTTLFVDPRWPERVGIFVKLASEVGDE